MISGSLGTRSIGKLWVGRKADVSKLTAKQELFIATTFAGSKPSQAYQKAFPPKTIPGGTRGGPATIGHARG